MEKGATRITQKCSICYLVIYPQLQYSRLLIYIFFPKASTACRIIQQNICLSCLICLNISSFSHSSLYGSGNWDLKTKVPEQCKVSNIKLPPYFMEWINLKDIYLNFYSRRVTRVHPMLFVYQHLIIPVQLIFMDHC